MLFTISSYLGLVGISKILFLYEVYEVSFLNLN